MLFDTDIFIWIQKGIRSAAEEVERAGEERNASIISYMEFLQGSADKKMLATNKSFFQAMSIKLVVVTQEISLRASYYVEQFSLSHAMHANDALIAASAVEHGLTLVTGNGKHYNHLKELDLKVIRPS